MYIRLTKHALERLRERGISFKEIMECVRNPDKLFKDKFGNNIAQRRKGKYVLRVIFRRENRENIIIITAYLSSKLKKYL